MKPKEAVAKALDAGITDHTEGVKWIKANVGGIQMRTNIFARLKGMIQRERTNKVPGIIIAPETETIKIDPVETAKTLQTLIRQNGIERVRELLEVVVALS